MKATLTSLAAWLLVATTIHAEVLLATLHWEMRIPGADAGANLQFFTRIPTGPNATQAWIDGWYTPEDAGMTFNATADALVTMNQVFTSPAGRWYFAGASSRFFQSPDYLASDIWDLPQLANEERPVDATATMHVAQLGIGLTGYRLTTAAQTIDKFIAVGGGCGNCWTIDQAQTVRLYGVTVPEPTAWWLVIVGLLAVPRRQR